MKLRHSNTLEEDLVITDGKFTIISSMVKSIL